MATLAELDERLSFRLGEVDDGLWTSQEKKMVLNQAQVEVAKDLQQRGREWGAKMQYRIPCIDEAEYYLMPEDMMFLESVAHFYPGYSPRTLIEENVQNIRLNIRSKNSRYQARYQFYEMRGRSSGYIGIGVAEENSDASSLRDVNLNTSGLRVGDLVHNINDESYAPIDNFGSGIINLGEWIGG